MKTFQVLPNKQASSITFFFNHLGKKKNRKILQNLSKQKACQKSDIPLRIIKENTNTFTKFLTFSFNEAITQPAQRRRYFWSQRRLRLV